MQIYSGKSVFSGIAIGKICVYQKSEQQVKRVRTEDSEKEWTRYNEAKEKALDQLRGLYEKALKEVGEAYPYFKAISSTLLSVPCNSKAACVILRLRIYSANDIPAT